MAWRSWLCSLAAVVLAAATLAVFGLTWWSIVGVIVLLACPVSAAWAWIAGERELRVLKRLRASLSKGGSSESRPAA